MTGQKLSDLLNSSKNGDLGGILERAESIGALTDRLAAALPADLAESLVAANVATGGQLVIVARSSAFAARLRFEEERLIAAARSAGEVVDTLKVRVTHST